MEFDSPENYKRCKYFPLGLECPRNQHGMFQWMPRIRPSCRTIYGGEVLEGNPSRKGIYHLRGAANQVFDYAHHLADDVALEVGVDEERLNLMKMTAPSPGLTCCTLVEWLSWKILQTLFRDTSCCIPCSVAALLGLGVMMRVLQNGLSH